MSFLIQTLVLKVLKESLMALVGKLPWRAIAERLISRLVVTGLRKLAAMSSNELVDKTVEDVIRSIQTPTLPELK